MRLYLHYLLDAYYALQSEKVACETKNSKTKEVSYQFINAYHRQQNSSNTSYV